MDISKRCNDLIEKSARMLFFQQQVRETCQIALGIAESLHRKHIVADPVQIDTDQLISVKEDPVVELHCAVADGKKR